ncbi:PD-(D/E)XK nuclease family protein [bacterium]|nr:PD-(D/E)XK nuclease family protein [bacterium]
MKRDIAAVCRDHLFDEKIIITSASSSGRQLRERCARDGTPWLNLHARSVDGFARHILGDEDAVVTGLLTPGQSERLMRHACEGAIPEDSAFAALRSNRGFHRALLQGIEDCELAGLDPATLAATAFGDSERGRVFVAIHVTFAKLCAQRNRSTRSMLLRAALAAARESTSTRILLVEPSLLNRLPAVARELLEAAGDLHEIEARDARSTLHVHRAERPEWEVRAAFRTVLDSELRWEDAEIVLMRGDLLPLAYELSRQLDIPCTFDPGIPLHYSKAARTVTAYLRWISSDFAASHLIRMMYDGVPDFSEWKHEGVRGGRLSTAALLREAAIGWGRDRYLPRIDALIARRGTDEKISARDLKKRREFLADRAWIARLLEVTPHPDVENRVGLHALAEATRILVTDMSRDKYPGEQQALAELLRLLTDYLEGEDEHSPVAELSARVIADIRSITYPLVLQEPGAEPLLVTTPRPGHLHVSTAGRGGYSGRPCTLLLGADAATLPSPSAQNPVLLDSDRRAINLATGSHLPLASEKAEHDTAAFHALVSRITGQLHVSWSERDAQDGSVRFPSHLLLDLLRREQGDPQLGYDDLERAAGAPLSAAPLQNALSLAEYWLQRSITDEAEVLRHRMREALPLLARGSDAEAARAGDTFTAYDGSVAAEGVQHALPSPLSASRLEAFAKCPYRFFLSTILHLSPPDPWDRDAAEWLDAAQLGSAVHTILERFMDAVRAKNDFPVRPAHLPLLQQILTAVLTDTAERVPAPSALHRSEGAARVQDLCERFFRLECAEPGTPLALEQNFGHNRGEREPLPPLEIAVPGGTLQVSGGIDRVDSEADSSLLVRDYKTGKRHFDASVGLGGGKHLQHALYVEAVRTFFAQHRDVVAAEYVFLGENEGGLRLRMPDASAELPVALGHIRECITQGIYPHTPEKDECRHCDFAELCGSDDSVNIQSRQKLENAGNRMLDAWRSLRNV